MAACVFCELVARDQELVLHDGDVAAFLDHRPVFHGHVLVVPTAHVETLAELPRVAATPLLAAVQDVMAALAKAVDAEGTFVAVNNRVSQAVAHLHVHVVPRRRGDGLRGFFWPRHPYTDDAQRAAVRDRVRAGITAVRGVH